MKISKVYPRDIIAFFVLMFALFLIYLGINAIVSGIVIMIVTYYFSKRTYEETNPNGNISERMIKLEMDKIIHSRFLNQINSNPKYFTKPNNSEPSNDSPEKSDFHIEYSNDSKNQL